MIFTRMVLLVVMVLVLVPACVLSFSSSATTLRYSSWSKNDSTALRMFFAEEAESEAAAQPAKESAAPAISSDGIQLVTSDNEQFLNAAGAFLVDSFWLGSDHHFDSNNDDDDAGTPATSRMTMSADARMNLIIEQAADLQEKYGETMGKRLSRAIVTAAFELDEFVGVVTLKETLMNNHIIIEAEKAESIAKNAVADLGPKQRREYKNASMQKIATDLLSDTTTAVCVLSNLAVSTKARRRGVAQTLCRDIELLAKEDWGYNAIHLLVESENSAARALYEKKLGFQPIRTNENATALRINFQTGDFIEIQKDTLVMSKLISET